MASNRQVTVTPRGDLSARGVPGYTLMEIMIVIILMAMLGAAVSIGLGGMSGSRFASDTEKLAAVVRYVHHYSVMNNVACRLVIEMDSGMFYGEYRETKGRFLLDVEKEKLKMKGEEEKKNDEEEKKKPKDTWAVIPIKQFTTYAEREEAKQQKGTVGDKRRLSKSVTFKSVMTPHHEEPSKEGRVEIYFFPNGTVEKAHVAVAHGDDVKTIVIAPLTAKVTVQEKELETSDFNEESR